MDTEEALRRVRLITPMSHLDVKRANETVAKGLYGDHTEFSATYNAGQHRLTTMLALDLARIFDLSEGGRFPPEKQDKASIPVLAALLGRPDIQAELVQDPGNWFPGIGHVATDGSAAPEVIEEALKTMEEDYRSGDRQDCSMAIRDFLTVAACLEADGAEHRAAPVRIRQFRNRRLAHSLIDKEPDEPPRYAALSLLLEVAKRSHEARPILRRGAQYRFQRPSEE